MTVISQQNFQPIQRLVQSAVPPGLVDVAYLDGGACAAAGAMSISQWLTLVKDGKAPQPVIRKPRFTRWLMSDVREFLIKYRTDSDFEKDSASVVAKATIASKAAKTKAASSRQIQHVAA